MSDRLIPSTLTLPERSERDAAVKSLEAKCQKIVNLAHDVADAESRLYAAERELKIAIADHASVDALLAKYGEASRFFGSLEADLYNLKDQIEEELKVANRDKRFGIYVSHTAEGLPIRVSTTMKKRLWG